MTSDQNKRLVILSLIGSVVTGLVTFGNNAQATNITQNLLWGISGFTLSLLSIQILWRIMLRRGPETKYRGGKYGACAGLFALIIIVSIASYKQVFENPSDIDSLVVSLIIVPVFISIMAFFIFGFIAPLLGAILGYCICRDLDHSDTPSADLAKKPEI